MNITCNYYDFPVEIKFRYYPSNHKIGLGDSVMFESITIWGNDIDEQSIPDNVHDNLVAECKELVKEREFEHARGR